MKQLLSLFDYSGTWSEPYLNAGWEVHQWDIKIRDFLDINLLDSCETLMDLFPYDIDGIIAAPPCTDFANSGAQYWTKKDAEGITEKSMELIRQILRTVDFFKPTDPDYEKEMGKFFWCIENPIGRLPKLFPELGKPYIFDPFEFAGHLDWNNKINSQYARIGNNVDFGIYPNKDEVNFILEWNVYTKRTCLFGEFDHPVKKPVPPIRTCKQGSPTQLLGGKSERTKELRSNTPLGFAKAFYEANKGEVK